MIGVFLRTTGYLIRAQARTPLFAVLFAVLLACSTVPLFMDASPVKAVVICDEDSSGLSRELAALINEKNAVSLRTAEAADLPHELSRLKSGVVEAVFVISRGYGERMTAGEYKDLVRLYLSPYSTSSKTFSDSVAAIVMSQWLGHAVNERALEALNSTAGQEAARLYRESGAEPILTLQVEGELHMPGLSDEPLRRAHNGLITLAVVSCFLLLCLPYGLGQERSALLDRFASRGWCAAGLVFAQPATIAPAAAVAAAIPCVALAVTSGALQGVGIWLMFVLYLAVWIGISALLVSAIRVSAVQLAFAVILAILNAILAFPAGLSQGFGPARALVAGHWFSSALQQGVIDTGLLALAASAIVACGAGLFASRIRQ